jgi:predicted metalloprotease with PDZ domain
MSSMVYQIRLANPSAHLYEVVLRVSEPDPAGQCLSLPAWIPGSYMIRDFAKNIVTLTAACGDVALAVTKTDKQTWRCAPCAGELLIRYQVFAWDLSVRSAHFDNTHAYFNGTSVFLRVQGRENEPCHVELPAPGFACPRWRVATSLPRREVNQAGFGWYWANDYEDLIDHPVEIGDFADVTFMVADKPHRVVISGRQHADLNRIAKDLTRICEQHVSLFGEVPLEEYWFLITVVGEGYGGLEHRASTSLLCSRDDLPRCGETALNEEYRRFLSLCSHEYFHLWNVKRIRPQVFVENGLEREVHTRLLWVFEGFTSYYDDLALLRCGCIQVADYLGILAQTISRVARGAGRLKQSVADSSFDAWTKFYKQDENAPNAIVSYYTKGALIALCLDLILRTRCARACTLDDVMRALWQRFGRPAQGVPETAVERLIEELSGLDLHDFFRHAVHGTTELPLADLLEKVGIAVHYRPANDVEDFGGVVEQFTQKDPKSVLGLRLASATEAKVSHVFDAGAAQHAGISPGDVLLAIDGIKVTPSNLDKRIAAVPNGKTIRLHLFRRDELMALTVTPLPAPADTCELRLMPDVDGATLSLRKAWLGAAD